MVEVEGHWFLVTAGHVITDIRAGVAAGVTYAEFALHDSGPSSRRQAQN